MALANTPTILALHGFTGCGEDFLPIKQDLASQGIAITWKMLDLPGHGSRKDETSPEAYTFEGMRVWVHTQVMQQKECPILMGYSMGARVVLDYACSYPEFLKALILISPNPGIENEVSRKLRRLEEQALAEFILKQGIPAFMQKWQEHPLIRCQRNIPQAILSTMDGNRLKNKPEGLARALRGLGQGGMLPLWSRLPTLELPVSIFTGREDTRYSQIAQRMVNNEGLPYGVHYSVSESGHCPHLENAPNFFPLFKNSIEKESQVSRLSESF